MLVNHTLLKKITTIVCIMMLTITPLAASATVVIIADPTPDTIPPILNDFSISANEAAPESTIRLTADVSDDLSGVKSVYGYYSSPNQSSKGIGFTLNQTTGKYEADLRFSEFDADGEWVLNSIHMRDNKDNTSSVSSGGEMDFSSYSIRFTGGIVDTMAPVLDSITISSNSQIRAGNSVKLSAQITDDLSGVSNASASFIKPSGRYAAVPLSYNQSNGKYEGTVTIDAFDELGEWRLIQVGLRDRANNARTVYDLTAGNQSDKSDFSSLYFEVVETRPDLIAPFLDSLAISLEQVTSSGAVVKLTAAASDRLAGVSNIYAAYEKPNGQMYTAALSQIQNEFAGSILIDKYDQLGTWKLKSLTLRDRKQNTRQVGDHSTGYTTQDSKDLSPFHFTVRGAITIPPSAPFSIVTSANELTLEPGASHQLQAYLHYTDHSQKDITLNSSGTVYTSSNPSAVNVDENGLVTVAANAEPGTSFISLSNSGLYGQVKIIIPGNENPIRESLQVSPLKVSLAPGQAFQLYVEATTANGTTQEVADGSTGTAYSSDSSFLSVNSNGLISVSPLAVPGTAKITVEHNGMSNVVTVTITGPPTVKSLAMTPDLATIKQGETIQLSVRAAMSDGSSKDVTLGEDGTTYTSANLTRAQVSADGLVTIPSNATNGEVTITARNSGEYVRVKVTVSGPVLRELQVTASKTSVFREDVIELSVVGTYTDEAVKDLTSSSTGTTYVSAVPSRAVVDANGVVTIPASATYGVVTITVKNGTESVPVVITVVEDLSNKLTAIDVTPISRTLYRGGSASLAVMGTYGSGAERDITLAGNGTTYISAVPSRALVDANGVVTIPASATYGNATITVKNGTLSVPVVITVAEDLSNKLTALSVTPTSSTLNRNGTVSLAVKGTYGNGAERDVTSAGDGTTYVSSVPSRALVDANGVVTIPASATYGNATITVKNGTQSVPVVITVEEDLSNKLTALSVTPTSSTLNRGGSLSLAVKGTYGSGVERDVTLASSGTTYVSSVPSRALVDANGIVTIPASATYGNATITVKNGTLSVPVVITVEEDLSNKLTALSVTPTSSTLNRGGSLSLAVRGTYANGVERDAALASSGTTYVSSVPSRAMVDANGVVTIPASATYGNATITVKNGTQSVLVVITVEEDLSNKLTALSVTPTSSTLHRGGSVSLAVKGTFGNGVERDVTSAGSGTTYISAVPSRAMVDANGVVTIPASASYGNATITIKNGTQLFRIVITVVQ